ncbi:MAG: ABC transporter permease [Dehalococcoidia bacterium]
MTASGDTRALSSDVLIGAQGARSSRQRSLWNDAWRRLVRNHAAVLGLAIVLLLCLVALLAPLLAPYSYEKQNLLAIYQAPSSAHLLGTDGLGRDELSRLIFGARISMSVAVATIAIVLAVGLPLGLIAGYYGGLIDFVLMRVIDVLFAFPYILLIIIVSAYLGAALPRIHSGPLLFLKDIYVTTGGLVSVILALSLIRWLSLTRLVRGQVLSIKQREYVEGARAIGATDTRIMLQYLLTNALAPIIVATALFVPQIIIAEAGLSFIGLGVKPPVPSWGSMIADGVNGIRSHPYVALEPGLAIAITLLSFNFLGDGLRDALDPSINR